MLGYLRENKEKAMKSGVDPLTGLNRNGLDEYLKVIFPDVDDWIMDKQLGNINGITYKIRPDYRSETLKLVIEFNGLPHYQKPDVIISDYKKYEIYEKLGYKVVIIPYFIQLTADVVYDLFGIHVNPELLFPEGYPSLSILNKNTPAFLCDLGVKRMAHELNQLPSQRRINMEQLIKENDDYLTGLSLIKKYIKE